MSVFAIVQITIAILLIVTVMLQSRGTDAGIAFGGGSESFRSKRGLEKFLFYSTIILSILFASNSILALIA